LTEALAGAQRKLPPLFAPGFEPPFRAVIELLSNHRGSALGYGASLMKVFLPYLTYNTVFDNTRVVSEVNRAPVPFSRYCFPLFKFARDAHFSYPYRPWPGEESGVPGAE
jgi:hypothetical protein